MSGGLRPRRALARGAARRGVRRAGAGSSPRAARREPRRAAPPARSLGAALFALLAAGGCGAPEQGAGGVSGCRLPALAAAPGRSVVLVVNDTMRWDFPAPYGGPARTPALDELASQGLVFEDARAPSPWTKPSVATLFTGLPPRRHGMLTHPGRQRRAGQPLGRPLRSSDVLGAGIPTLAGVLRDAGYRTGAFVANPWLDRRFGFARGFEHYDDALARWGVAGSRVVDAALAWVASLPPDRPFLLYVHTLDSHRPHPPVPWREIAARPELLEAPAGSLPPRAWQELRRAVRVEGAPPGARPRITPAVLRVAYRLGVERFDRNLARLLRGLAEDPRGPGALVLVTSDHGEALFERGYGNHGNALFDEEIRIPLLLRMPGLPAARVPCPVGLEDVFPTLCAALGLRCPSGLPGRSLLGPDLPGERVRVAEGVSGRPRNRAAAGRRFKLHRLPDGGPGAPRRSPPERFHDLVSDPAERIDLLAGGGRGLDPEVRLALDRLREVLDRAARDEPVRAPGQVPLDPELERRLRELGYLGEG